MKHLSGFICLILCTNVTAEKFGEYPSFEEVGHIPNISVVALLGNPGRWENKLVSVFGYAKFDHHGTLLFTSSEHCRGHHSSYSIQLVVDKVPSLERALETSNGCVELRSMGIYEPNEYEDPEPGTLVFREVPGYLYVSGATLIGPSK